MALAMAHPTGGYYPRRDPLGAAGDFVTAPEMSQLFGELIGLALVQHWLDLGRPQRVALVELGPGRGTLMADAMRAARVVPQLPRAISIHLVETSPVLRERQAAALPGLPVHWHDELGGVPADRPTAACGERIPRCAAGAAVRPSLGPLARASGRRGRGDPLRFVLAPRPTPFPEAVGGVDADMADDTLLELAPAREALAQAIAMRLAAQGGMALLIDYGSDREVMTGDSLRAVRRHAAADPLPAPGEADLSSHVDFRAAGTALRIGGGARFSDRCRREVPGAAGHRAAAAPPSGTGEPAQRRVAREWLLAAARPRGHGHAVQGAGHGRTRRAVPPGFMQDERWR